MRSFVLGLFILCSIGFAEAQPPTQQVDFKNFTYPLSGPLLGHDRLVWLRLAKTDHVTLKNGKDDSGFVLQSVKFANVTDDGKEDAIVVLRFDWIYANPLSVA
jgi:hypothetical protein